MDLNTLGASCAASIVSRLICYPLDTIAIQHASSTKRPFFSVPLRSYYRGLGASTVLVTPAISLYFMIYRQSKTLFLPYLGDCTVNYIVSGAIAEVASSFVWTPLEVIKSRLQISNTATEGSVTENIHQIWRQEGIRGFYRGYLLGLAVFIPYNGIWWTTYEHTKKATPIGTVPFAQAACGGVVATSISTILCYPLDLIKTRYQVATTATVSRVGGERLQDARSITHVVRNVLKEGGWRGYYKGLWPRIVCSAPSSLISMAVLEYISPDLTSGSIRDINGKGRNQNFDRWGADDKSKENVEVP